MDVGKEGCLKEGCFSEESRRLPDKKAPPPLPTEAHC